MSENLRMLGEYSAAMARGDTEAVYGCFSPEFVSHVADRVNPDVIGTDIRSSEEKWWSEARAAFPDMTFVVMDRPPAWRLLTAIFVAFGLFATVVRVS